MKKLIKVYALRDTRTGKYENGAGYYAGPEGKRYWVPKATEESQEDACEWDQEDIDRQFPDGLPAGWEAVLLYEFEPKARD